MQGAGRWVRRESPGVGVGAEGGGDPHVAVGS